MSELLNVLVVDDEEGMRLGIQRALRSFSESTPYLDEPVGLSLQLAGSGEEALRMIDNRQPDIMLLDHKLPGMSGTDVLQKLSEKNTAILTLMITAYASLNTAIQAIKNGAFDFIAKPFTPAELKAGMRKAVKHLLAERQAARLAEEKKKVRFEFMRVLTHELKAPLAAVENFMQILKDPDNVKDHDVYMHVIQRCTNRVQGMRKLIMDLLDLTTIEAGTRTRNIQTVDLRHTAETAMETVAGEAERREIDLELQVEGDVTLQADPSEMDILFNNLVTNSVKYNRDYGSVEITLRRTEDSCLEIVVKDTGIGMTEKDTARLFNDFVRIKNAKTRGIEGSGLGLSTVKKLAIAYGGDVQVESTPDVGTTFTVTLLDEPRESGEKVH